MQAIAHISDRMIGKSFLFIFSPFRFEIFQSRRRLNISFFKPITIAGCFHCMYYNVSRLVFGGFRLNLGKLFELLKTTEYAAFCYFIVLYMCAILQVFYCICVDLGGGSVGGTGSD